MLDRILSDEGKPQLYGSQIVDGKLYELDSLETVDQRRAEMGMSPLADYLKMYHAQR